MAEAASNSGINANMLSGWKREIGGDRNGEAQTGSNASFQAELKRLPKENKRLKMEREIQKRGCLLRSLGPRLPAKEKIKIKMICLFHHQASAFLLKLQTMIHRS